MATNLKRRKFLRNALLTTGGIFLVPNFISCKDDDDFTDEIPSDLTEKNFNQGVASFDPTNSQVIIWTRYSTNENAVDLTWQIATDDSFENIVRQGEVTTDASRDYTVAIEVQDLDENQYLYYRFIQINDETISPIGETITFGNTTTEVKLAVASCSNYASGYFNVYEAISDSDADVVIHLGDYIYEYGESTYGSFRSPDPVTEIISLDEYRTRYRQYREDEKLKELHRKKPFICVWDDHEITNDSHKTGAQNHQEDEGDYETRKADALQAYSEYLPNTTNIIDSSVIYRNLQIGNLIDLIMLDTRISGRDQQLEYSNYYTATGFDTLSFQTDLLDQNRTMLGETQKSWFMNEISGASSSWQIIGQQVLMGKMFIPAEMLTSFGSITAEIEATGSASAETFLAFQELVTALVTIKGRMLAGDPTITDAEKARVTTTLPYNLDAWDGYYMEREQILASFTNKNVVVLAGDTHNAWQNSLVTITGDKVADEVATSSVSSPGLEVYLGAGVTSMESALQLLIDDLNYLDASNRGFVKLTVTADLVNTEWNYVDSVLSDNYVVTLGNSYII